MAAICLGLASLRDSSDLPKSNEGCVIGLLFGLAPGGVYNADFVTEIAVRSYHTISPLPAYTVQSLDEIARRYIFCCTFRQLAPPRRYLAPCPWSPDFPPEP